MQHSASLLAHMGLWGMTDHSTCQCVRGAQHTGLGVCRAPQSTHMLSNEDGNVGAYEGWVFCTATLSTTAAAF